MIIWFYHFDFIRSKIAKRARITRYSGSNSFRKDWSNHI